MQVRFKDRDVEISCIEFARDVEDTQVVSAYYTDDEAELSEDELIALSTEVDLSAEHAEHWTCVAEDWADAQADR